MFGTVAHEQLLLRQRQEEHLKHLQATGQRLSSGVRPRPAEGHGGTNPSQEMRMLGVWEVDEFGGFVQKEAAPPGRSESREHAPLPLQSLLPLEKIHSQVQQEPHHLAQLHAMNQPPPPPVARQAPEQQSSYGSQAGMDYKHSVSTSQGWDFPSVPSISSAPPPSTAPSTATPVAPKWTPAAPLPQKSLMQIQQEEAEQQRFEMERLEAEGPSVGAGGPGSSGYGPWKAPDMSGLPKSLKAIQEEEARVARLNSQNKVDSPGAHWGSGSGVFTHPVEQKVGLRDVIAEEVLSKVAEITTGSLPSQTVPEVPSTPILTKEPQAPVVEETDFVEAKESKKSKKRATKSKSGLSSKSSKAATIVVASPEPVVSRSSSGKEKPADPELPAPPPASLADFLPQEQAPAQPPPPPAWASSAVRPAKGAALSLKEIQQAEQKAREELAKAQFSQEQQQSVGRTKATQVAGGSWTRPSAPSPTPAPVTNFPATAVKSAPSSAPAAGRGGAVASKSAHEDDDELFWDYKQSEDVVMTIGTKKTLVAPERQDYPSLGATVTKKGGSVASVPPPRSIPTASPLKPSPYPSSAPLLRSPVVSASRSTSDFPSLAATGSTAKNASKGKKSTTTTGKQDAPSAGAVQSSEARSFRLWCESSMKKLTGNDDMTLIEFCMTLPTEAAAETGEYISQYLGSTASVESFKTEFLRRKALLAPSVARAAFHVSEAVIQDTFNVTPGRSSKSIGGKVETKKEKVKEETRSKVVESREEGETEAVSAKKGETTAAAAAAAKKKGKKGKKVVDPSLLGFSVTSNRIMIGEIQRVEDL